MARRGWGGSIATALGVAAGAGAAQLGFGYGLGIINWAPPDGAAGPAAWVASLIWATWIAATSTVLGAVCTQRLRERGSAAGRPGPGEATGIDDDADEPVVPTEARVPGDDAPADGEGAGDAPPETAGGGTPGWLAVAVAAAMGALITVLLVAVPARVAVVPDTSSPRNVAAIYAALGVLLGLSTAIWALQSRAVATNVIATVGWLWLLAVVAVVDGVRAGRGLTSAQLGIWQLSSGDERFWIRDWFYWPGAVLSLGSALLIGALAARRATRYADRRVGAIVSGAAGPLLVATAYLLAVPRMTAVAPEQVSAHLIAPYAVIVGAGGSVLVAMLAQRAARQAAVRTPARVPRQRTAEPPVVPTGDPVTADPTAGRVGDEVTARPPGVEGASAGSAPAPGATGSRTRRRGSGVATSTRADSAEPTVRPPVQREPEESAAKTSPAPAAGASDDESDPAPASPAGGRRDRTSRRTR